MLPQAVGKYLVVACEEVFVADTAADARAWVDSCTLDDDGAWVHFVPPPEVHGFMRIEGEWLLCGDGVTRRAEPLRRDPQPPPQ